MINGYSNEKFNINGKDGKTTIRSRNATNIIVDRIKTTTKLIFLLLL